MSVAVTDRAARRTRRWKDLSIVAAVGMAAAIVAGAATQNRWETNWWALAASLAVGGTIVVAGHIGWARRPESLIGPILVVAGLMHLAMNLNESGMSVFFTIALLAGQNYQSVLAHAIITFPSGRMQNRWERVLVVAVYANGILGFTVATFFQSYTFCPCPSNLVMIADAPALADGIVRVSTFLSVFVAGGFVWYAVRKYRRSTPAGKHALAPVYLIGAIAGVFSFVAEASYMWFPSVVNSVPWFWTDLVVTVLVPISFLIGLQRTRIDRAAVGDLVVELGAGSREPGALADALAERLHDPSLEIAYRVGDGYVDDEGRPFTLPSPGAGRGVTIVESDGEPVAAVVHDDVVTHEPELVEAVLAAARLAIANERLRAEIRAQLEEVRASRQRIVEAGDRERRRVERNLHDGAQQRLVTLSLAISMLGERRSDDPEFALAVDEASAELKTAIAELRELARGIHPAILTEEGLEAAVTSLAEHASVPVTVTSDLEGRVPGTVEAAAYFVVAEALTNVAKYSEARTASVSIGRIDGRLSVSVEDDGIGGASADRGSGLLGLVDRVAAAGGTLQIDSPPGEGTRVTAEIPVDGLSSAIGPRP